MTGSALHGDPLAYYPEGREAQRPLTLVPHPGESAQDVVGPLPLLSDGMDEEWSALDLGAWGEEVVEPKDNPDLGPIRLGHLPLLRLTEVEVHGTDLGLNLGDWSDLFISTVLPMRLEWLLRRTGAPTRPSRLGVVTTRSVLGACRAAGVSADKYVHMGPRVDLLRGQRLRVETNLAMNGHRDGVSDRAWC